MHIFISETKTRQCGRYRTSPTAVPTASSTDELLHHGDSRRFTGRYEIDTVEFENFGSGKHCQ